MQSLAIAGYVVGGVSLAVGAWLAYFNRFQAFRTKGGATGALIPLLTPSGGSASVVVSF
jgi:hypothetical protein